MEISDDEIQPVGGHAELTLAYSFLDEFVWRPCWQGNVRADIKCLNNPLLALYLGSYISIGQFHLMHQLLSNDVETWTETFWTALADIPRLPLGEEPVAGDIVVLDGTKHSRIFLHGDRKAYGFAEYTRKRGWLSSGWSDQDWRPTNIHEFLKLSKVSDWFLREIWYHWCRPQDLSRSSICIPARVNQTYVGGDCEGDQPLNIEVRNGNWDDGGVPEFEFLSVAKGERVNALSDTMPSRPSHYSSTGYVLCQRVEMSSGVGWLPATCLTFLDP